MTETPPSTPATLLLQEMAANLDALMEHTFDQIHSPPSGAIADVGHWRLLNSLKKKELDAIETVLADFTYNVAATVLAMLDGVVEGEEVALPTVAITLDGEPLTEKLHETFAQVWEE